MIEGFDAPLLAREKSTNCSTVACWLARTRAVGCEGTGSNVSMLSIVRGTRKRSAARGKSQETVNARRWGRHEKARAELTGAAGNHTSSAGRAGHGRLADIDLPPAFVRRNHAVSWTARDDT